ncbi:3070_t:CDS:2, partial [Ambispora leptoticha]
MYNCWDVGCSYRDIGHHRIYSYDLLLGLTNEWFRHSGFRYWNLL